jgi:predicted HTH domain antitoxin
MLDAIRTLTAAPTPVPPALLEHGLVTKRRAAKMLGVPLKEFERITAPGAWVSPEQRLPTLENGMVPISEIRRAFERRQRAALEKAASEALRAASGLHWSLWMGEGWAVDEDLHVRDAVSIEKAAQLLGMSKAAVNRLAKDNGPDSLFVRRHKRVRGWVVTTAELEAYGRKLEKHRAAHRTPQKAVHA